MKLQIFAADNNSNLEIKEVDLPDFDYSRFQFLRIVLDDHPDPHRHDCMIAIPKSVFNEVTDED